MARIRYLKPDFFKDEDVGALPFEVRLFFQGLWVLADRDGRLEDRPMRLKAEIFPYDDVDVSRCLSWLVKPKGGSGLPFIYRYSVDGQRFIQIVSWSKHQRPHGTERGSTIPPYNPPNGNGNGKEKVDFGVPLLDNGEVTVKEPLKKRVVNKFTPPSLEEVESYCQDIDYSELDAGSFIDFYESKGWMVGKNKMKCWKSAVRTWKRRQKPDLVNQATRAADEDEIDNLLGFGK